MTSVLIFSVMVKFLNLMLGDQFFFRVDEKISCLVSPTPGFWWKYSIYSFNKY